MRKIGDTVKKQDLRLDLRKVLLVKTNEDRKIEAVCGVDERQAQIVLDLLQQPRGARLQCGLHLARCLDDLQAQQKLTPDASIMMSVRSPGGIVTSAPEPLYWRVCRWLMYVLASDNQSAIDLCCSHLKQFLAGTNDRRVINAWAGVDFAPKIQV